MNIAKSSVGGEKSERRRRSVKPFGHGFAYGTARRSRSVPQERYQNFSQREVASRREGETPEANGVSQPRKLFKTAKNRDVAMQRLCMFCQSDSFF
ncbi:MAG: hypothetical protein KME40_12270 [Komarekiella atlantica HA4396-MV6]|nr:hypothetical protein [Komarekiella atlantica HA4396-MV6]